MKIVIMRGIPGSGKSTYARSLNADVIVSADDYFMVLGTYHFDSTQLGEAHKSCMKRFLHAVRLRKELIVVDNTNSTPVEIAPYVAVGEAEGYEVEIVEIEADTKMAHARNIHAVPLKSINNMCNRMRNNKRYMLPPWWTVKKIAAA